MLVEIADRSTDPGRAVALKVESARQEANQLHYGDLLRHAQRILQIPTVAHLYQSHFGAILVDEFQDMSLQHLDLVRQTCLADRTYVGDPDQDLHLGWSGACSGRGDPEAGMRTTFEASRVLPFLAGCARHREPNMR